MAGIHFLVLAALYAQTFSHGFVYFDDDGYVLNNTRVRAGLSFDSIRWAFSTLSMANWHPLTWLSYMLDASLFGVQPGWFLLHNAMLHGLNGLLVYAILLRLSGAWLPAFLASLVFLVHPLHVESVAWIAQRKDVLSSCFYLLSFLCYLHMETGGRRAFLAALTFCALALMAKPMAVTLPLVLVLLDTSVYRRPLVASVIEKWPMWLLCMGAGLLTLKAQGDGGAMSGLDIHSLEMRLSTVVWGYATYLRQFLLPVELAVFYPLREQHSIQALAAATLVIAALLVTALRLRRSEPLVALGIGFFFVTLLPVIGVLQVGVQAHADRYMYLPLLGLLIALMPPLCRFFTQRTRLVASLAVIAIAFLSLLAYWQVGYWQNRGTLFSRALSVNGPLYLAHLKLADEFNDRGDQETALMHALNALELEPDRAYAQIALGDIALARSDLQSAQRYYMEAVSMSQENSFLLDKIGVLWARQGRIGDALGLFQRALELSPEYYPARQNLELYAPVLPGLDRN